MTANGIAIAKPRIVTQITDRTDIAIMIRTTIMIVTMTTTTIIAAIKVGFNA